MVLNIKYWFAVALRNHHIRGPYTMLSRQLDEVHSKKLHHINNKQTVIEKECNPLRRTYNFLISNESFLIGAQGEEYVIEALSQLSDEYHIINDVNIRFERAIYWKKYDEYIKNCQIDHIVAGPTGIFLVETKNWKRSDIEIKSNKLIHQVKRANLALWYYIKDYYRGRKDQPNVRNVIISMKGSNSGCYLDKYIDIITPSQICNYIKNRQAVLPETSVIKFVKILVHL